MTNQQKIIVLKKLRDLMADADIYITVSHDGVGDGTIGVCDTQSGEVLYDTVFEFVHASDIDQEIINTRNLNR